MSRSGSAVGRMCRTIITFEILTIDVLRLGEDQVTADGTLFKGEMSVTHLPPFSLGFFAKGKGRNGGKRGRTSDGGRTKADQLALSSAEVRGRRR